MARNFKPLSEDDIQKVLTTSRNPSQDGNIEQYKNPQSGFGCSYHSRILQGDSAAMNPGSKQPVCTGYGGPVAHG